MWGRGVTVRVYSRSPIVGVKLSALGLSLEQIKTVDVKCIYAGALELFSGLLLLFAVLMGGLHCLVLVFWRCFFVSGPCFSWEPNGMVGFAGGVLRLGRTVEVKNMYWV